MDPVAVDGTALPALAHKSPWQTMWFSPRITVRRLIDDDPPRSWFAVVFFAGLSQAISSLDGRYDQLIAGPGAVIIVAALNIVMLPFGVVVGSILVAFVGGKLGGKGDADDVRQAVAWSLVPIAASCVLWIPLVAAFGLDIFRPNPPGPETVLQWMTFPLMLVIGVTALWSAVLSIPCVAEAMRISLLRAFAVFVILALPLFVLAAVMR